MTTLRYVDCGLPGCSTGVTTQNTTVDTFTAVRTSNLKYINNYFNLIRTVQANYRLYTGYQRAAIVFGLHVTDQLHELYL